jgi:prolyl-tRNA synthetase
MDIWFKTKLKNKKDLGLAPTHEEPITNLMKKFITSYKDLPIYAYQFQTKFRNETRAKSGIPPVST